MSNTITIEFCTEDRARIDRLAAALEAMQAGHLQPTELDPVQQALAKTLAKATATESHGEPQEEAEALTPATTPQEEETPTEETPAEPVTEKKVSQADVRALYVKLSASGKKDEAKAVILPISTTISGIPDDKVQEVYKKLSALEG